MAMSFVRPDPSSPASVADAAFGTSRRGFDQTEVRDFLRMVAAELGRLQERERFLERELRTAQTNPDLDNVRFDDATLTRLLGEETARVLSTAREAATEIREKAELNAARLLSEASDETMRMRQEAEVESSRRRADAASDAEAELAMAKQQGREMVNEARAYRERVLSELARRRELAREQIEQLMHGRDRLMQAFERARVVAVDVVAELKPLGEPDEYVNLSPTTGPVPVMLPNSRRPYDSIAADDQLDEPAVAGDVEAEPPADETDVDTAPADVEPTDVEGVDVEGVDGEGVDGEVGGELAGVENVDPELPDVEVADVELPDVELPDVDLADVEPVDAEIDTDVGEIDAEFDGDVDDDGPPEVDDERDDVVVDLFARIRAETDTNQSTEISGEPVTDDDPTAVADAGEDADVSDDGESDESPFRRRDAELTPLIVASARKLKRALADEQNEVLDGLRRGTAVLPARDQHIARFAEAIDDELRAAAAAGAASVATGRAAKLNKSQMTSTIGAGHDALTEWLVNPLRERLERSLADGEGDNEAIAKGIRAVYREWKTQHIDEQLDDVLRTTHGRAVLAALPDGAPVCWGVDAEHPACADGDDNALAGCVAAGTPFPTGHLFAPSHTGCRCLLVPADR
ncbi:MAG: DivIVA domain-containing protein [Ilumatobacteraceae bacterium]